MGSWGPPGVATGPAQVPIERESWGGTGDRGLDGEPDAVPIPAAPPTDPACARGFARMKGLPCEGNQLPTRPGSTSAATHGQVHVLGARVFEIETETPLICTQIFPAIPPPLRLAVSPPTSPRTTWVTRGPGEQLLGASSPHLSLLLLPRCE